MFRNLILRRRKLIICILSRCPVLRGSEDVGSILLKKDTQTEALIKTNCVIDEATMEATTTLFSKVAARTDAKLHKGLGDIDEKCVLGMGSWNYKFDFFVVRLDMLRQSPRLSQCLHIHTTLLNFQSN